MQTFQDARDIRELPVPEVEWIFGYGSLMWRPGFRFIEQHPARLSGYHRALCVFSQHHRGTPETPGLVLGLDEGGYCDGIVFRIDIKDRPQIIRYLHERELIGYAYRPLTADVDIGQRRVAAYTFVADSKHTHYAGDLGEQRTAEIVMRAVGESGLNRDYLMHTIEKLEFEGFVEPALHALLRRVRTLTGELDQGGGI